MALVDLLGVSKHYEAQKILENVNFHIDEGERVVIVGKNGSGKSTLMKIVAGVLDADEGERITRQGIQIKMLSQIPVFDPEHTVREAIEAGQGIRSRNPFDDSYCWPERPNDTHVEKQSRPDQFSMPQRMELDDKSNGYSISCSKSTNKKVNLSARRTATGRTGLTAVKPDILLP